MARLTQQQVEQWIAQNGGAQGLQYGVEQKQIKNPDPGGVDPYVNIEVEVWKNPKTGAVLTVQRGEDGDFEQIENVGPKPSADDDTPEKRQKAEEEREKQWNRDNGGLYETHAQRREREARENKEKVDRERQTRIDEQNAATRAAEARRAEAAEGRAAAEANKPTVKTESVTGGDGKPYTRITTVSADGKTTSVKNIGPDGKEVAEIPGDPTKAPGAGAEPEGAPRPSGKLGEAAADLEAYDKWLEPQVRSGKISKPQADKLREARRAYWEIAIKEQEGIVNAQSTAQGQAITQRGQTLSDIGNRRSSATSIANQAANDFMPLADKLGSAPGGGAALMNAIREARFNAQDFVTMSGGNRNVDEIQPGPALRTVNAMPLPGGPTMGPGFNPRPNAIGAGAVGNQAAPSAVGPVSAGVTATTAAAANPTGPNVQAATDATMAGSNAAFAGAGVPPAAAPAPAPERQITLRHRGTGLESKVSESMLQDMTNRDEFEEVPATADRQSMMMTQPQPAPHFLAGSSRGHVFDPTPSIRAMIADPRYDNETIRQVVNEDYPGYPIDDLLRGAA